MNFQTLNKQRKYILIAALLGIIGMFLPWIDVYIISINGMHGSGLLVFLCFVVCGIIALMGDQTKALEKTMWMVTMILSILPSLGMLIWFLRASEAIGTLSMGFYLALIAIIGLAFVAFYFRAAGLNLKAGFDSLKQDIIEKSKQQNPPPPPPQNPL